MHERFAQVVEPGSDEAKLLAMIDGARLPRHIAVIMDGNGRWAKMRGKPRIFGHKCRCRIRPCRSLDTCARGSKIEGGHALRLFDRKLETPKGRGLRPDVDAETLYPKRNGRGKSANNIRFQAIGNIAGLSEGVQKEISW